MEVRLRGAACDPQLENDLGNDDGLLVLHAVANLDWGRNVGFCIAVPQFGSRGEADIQTGPFFLQA
jgi:hypothetical protein